MTANAVSSSAKLTGIAPQFLVDDLDAAIAYYRDRLGFELDFCYESFYASVSRDGFAIHLKCAPKTIADRAHRRQHEHLDAYIGVLGAASLHAEFLARGARVTKALEERPWSARDFYVEDLDGYILCFSEPTAADVDGEGPAGGQTGVRPGSDSGLTPRSPRDIEIPLAPAGADQTPDPRDLEAGEGRSMRREHLIPGASVR